MFFYRSLRAAQSGKCYFGQHISPSTTNTMSLHGTSIRRNPTVGKRETKHKWLSLNPNFSLHEPNYRLQSIACGIEFATIKREETVKSWFQAIFSPLNSVRLNKLFAFMPTECTMHLMSCDFICGCFCSHVMPIICFHFKCNFRLFPQSALCRLSAWIWRTLYR